MEETNAFVLVANTHPACRDALLNYLDDPEMIEINNSDSFSVTACELKLLPLGVKFRTLF